MQTYRSRKEHPQDYKFLLIKHLEPQEVFPLVDETSRCYFLYSVSEHLFRLKCASLECVHEEVLGHEMDLIFTCLQYAALLCILLNFLQMYKNCIMLYVYFYTYIFILYTYFSLNIVSDLHDGYI